MFSPTGIYFVQSQQWKHQNNVWNLFKVKKKIPEQHWKGYNIFLSTADGNFLPKFSCKKTWDKSLRKKYQEVPAFGS